MAIWQDLVTLHGFERGYQSVKRFANKIRPSQVLQPRPVIVTAPGEEAQVDYGQGPMVRDPQTGKYRRTRLFVMTLGCSRKSVRLLMFSGTGCRCGCWIRRRASFCASTCARNEGGIASKKRIVRREHRCLPRSYWDALDEPDLTSVRCARPFILEWLVSLPLLILDDLGMRKLPLTAAEDLLEIIMRRYERASTLVTSNRPVEDWGKLLGDAAAVSALLDRLLHHGHVLKCGPRSWRTKTELSAAST